MTSCTSVIANDTERPGEKSCTGKDGERQSRKQQNCRINVENINYKPSSTEELNQGFTRHLTSNSIFHDDRSSKLMAEITEEDPFTLVMREDRRRF